MKMKMIGRASGFVVLVAALALSAGPMGMAQQLAADLPLPAPATVPPAAPSLHGYGDQDATCTAWGDGCRTCARDGDRVNCSNIGIACQPSAINCTARQQPAK